MELLFKIEEVLNVSGRGVILTPWLPISRFEGKIFPSEVTLKTSTGISIKYGAQFDIPRMSPPPKEYLVMCILKGASKDELEIGSEVWAEIENDTKANL